MPTFTRIYRRLLVLWVLLVFMSGARGRADSVRTLDLFTPRSAGSAAPVWRAGPGAPAARAVTGSAGGIRFACPFRDGATRVFWDRKTALDLSGVTAIELDISCARPEAIRSLGLYLKCGKGWRLWLVSLKEAGRQTLRLSLSEAAEEGEPASWDAISGLRVSFTRGAGNDAHVIIHAMRARTCGIVVVRAKESVPNADEGNAARNAAARWSHWLTDVGVAHTVVDDTRLDTAALKTARIVILPYNPTPSRRELRALDSFIKRGGKLVVCYSSEPRLAKMMGMNLGTYQVAARPGQWSSFAFNRDAPPRAPAVVFQESSNIRPVFPATDDARIIAIWRDADGKTRNDPAWVRSDKGYWMSHILTDGDEANKKQMVLALLGSLTPSVGRDAAEQTWNRTGKVASYRSLPESLAEIRRLDTDRSAESLLARVKTLDNRMRTEAGEKKYTELVDTGRELQTALVRAYAMVQQPRASEFRGVWNHAGTGLYPGDWNATCRVLSNAGISAVFPNLAWAGTALYPSRYARASSIVTVYGDQLKQSVAAARRYGLELHVWKICWNLGQAPDALVDQLRKAGRLQQTDSGKTLKWLCPTHPDNIAQELAMISELLGRAEVHGIHLDYMRYPNSHACFCPGCRRQFETWRGRSVRGWPDCAISGHLKASFTAWRANRITAFVRSARALIRQHQPSVKFSVAVYPGYPACATSLGQDWGAWLKEGLVDFVCPMDYAEGASAFNALLQRQMDLPKSRGRIYPGIGVTATESRLTPDQVIEQILKVRETGADGFMLFDLNRTLENDVLPLLRLGVTRTDR